MERHACVLDLGDIGDTDVMKEHQPKRDAQSWDICQCGWESSGYTGIAHGLGVSLIGRFDGLAAESSNAHRRKKRGEGGTGNYFIHSTFIRELGGCVDLGFFPMSAAHVFAFHTAAAAAATHTDRCCAS